MTDTAPTTTQAGRPRTSTLDRDTSMRLADTEYARFEAALRAVSPEDWTRRTDCPGWDVRAIAAHTLGMAEMAAGIGEGVRQLWRARRSAGVFIDALTAVQVADRAALSPEELIRRFAAVAPRAAKARRRTPAVVRRLRMPVQQAVGGIDEPWTIGFLVDTVLTRDPWMHRIDIARATGRDVQLTNDHDAVLVGDLVTEWALRHGSACGLRLTGPAGGTWRFGTGGPELELDAVEFCRILSGRAAGTGLLATQVPF